MVWRGSLSLSLSLSLYSIAYLFLAYQFICISSVHNFLASPLVSLYVYI
jgi:hypothetical protein